MNGRPGRKPASLRLHRLLFRLWIPEELRREIEEPALQAFEDLHAEARSRQGTVGVARLLRRELVSLIRAGWVERFGRHSVSDESPGKRRRSGTSRPGGWGHGLLGDVAGDLRVGARSLRRRPGFAVVAITALGLGVGMNTAILSLADAVFLRPLVYPDADRLGLLASERILDASGFSLSYPELQEIAERQRTFEEIAVFLDWRSVNLSGGDRPARAAVNFVGPDYFRMLGFRPALGSLFPPDGDAETGGEIQEGPREPVAILAHGLWRQRFGADPNVLGSTLSLDGRPFEVVGVLEPQVSDLGQRFGQRPEVYLPLSWVEPMLGEGLRQRRDQRYFTGLAREREGLSPTDVRADLERISSDLANEHPESNEGWRVTHRPLPELLLENARSSTLVLFGGAGLVLLLVCANVAGLLLIQGSERSGELAVRRALGAGRSRVVRQLVTESLLLAGLGGLLGTLIAPLGMRLLAHGDALGLPTFVTLSLDRRALTVALVLSLGTGALVGLTPALRAGRVGALGALRTRPGVGRGHRLRAAMLSAQIALAVVLMTSAALLVDSYRRLQATDLGYDADHLLSARLDLQGERYRTPQARIATAQQLLESTRALPGVEEALLWGPSRLGGGNWMRFVTREHRFDRIEERIEASRHGVLPGALSALGIPILRGRDLNAADGPDAEPVVLISEAVAETVWPHQDPLGRRLETVSGGERVTYEVIGVVADAKHRSRVADWLPADYDLYFSYLQEPERHLSVLVRLANGVGAGDREQQRVEDLARALRAELARIDPQLPIHQVGTIREQLEAEEAGTRLSAGLVSAYALLAMALAALGVYGVLALSVRQRGREIGLRLALGADRRDVVGLLLRQGLRVYLVGVAIGGVGAWAVSRLLIGSLYGAATLDLTHLLTVTACLAGTVALGALLPARQAIRIEPNVALHD